MSLSGQAYHSACCRSGPCRRHSWQAHQTGPSWSADTPPGGGCEGAQRAGCRVRWAGAPAQNRRHRFRRGAYRWGCRPRCRPAPRQCVVSWTPTSPPRLPLQHAKHRNALLDARIHASGLLEGLQSGWIAALVTKNASQLLGELYASCRGEDNLDTAAAQRRAQLEPHRRTSTATAQCHIDWHILTSCELPIARTCRGGHGSTGCVGTTDRAARLIGCLRCDVRSASQRQVIQRLDIGAAFYK